MKRLALSAVALTLALGGIALAAGKPVEPDAKPKPKTTKQPDPKLKKRIAELIKQLGDDDYEKREAAGKALLKIGRPTRKQIEVATRDKDPERATRASALLTALPDATEVNRDCTNGWMAAYKEVRQAQTFSVKEDVTISKLRFRAARCFDMPGTLSINLELVGAKKDAAALATASQASSWEKDGSNRSVTRYFRWFEVELKAKLKKGKTYKLVFSSADSTKSAPWLINCMYRDRFKAGTHLRQHGGKSEKLGAYDLVLQLCDKDKVKLTTVPATLDFSSKKEHFGLGHDGTNMSKNQNR